MLARREAAGRDRNGGAASHFRCPVPSSETVRQGSPGIDAGSAERATHCLFAICGSTALDSPDPEHLRELPGAYHAP